MWGHAILLDLRPSTGGLRTGGVRYGCGSFAQGRAVASTRAFVAERAGTSQIAQELRFMQWPVGHHHLGPRAGPRHVRDCTLARTVRRRATVPFHGVARQIERPQDKHVRLCAHKSRQIRTFWYIKVRQRRAFPHLTRPRSLGLSRLGRRASRPPTLRAPRPLAPLCTEERSDHVASWA